MALIKFIPVLLMLGVYWNVSMGAELTTQRKKRSLTTICVEIKPSGPLEEPYYMCKGTDLPPLVPNDGGSSYNQKSPSYASSSGNFQKQNHNQKQAYNTQYQDNEMETYEKQPINSKQADGTGYSGFRRPAAPAAASYQAPTPAAEQPDITKQQFFQKHSEFQAQQNYEQQQQQQSKQFKTASASQSASDYGFSTGKQQPASYAPSNSAYASESGPTQPQSSYGETSGNPSRGGGGGSGAFLRPQPKAASYGNAAKQVTTANAGTHGTFAKSAFASSLPHTSTSKASFDSTLPYANAAVASSNVEEHGYAQETPSAAFMVPADKKSSAVNIKSKNSSPSSYAADAATEGEQHSYASNGNGETPQAAALYQPNSAKSLATKINDYRSMLSEDIFQSPIWGFSPDEFASFRSIADEAEQPLSTAAHLPNTKEEAVRIGASQQETNRQRFDRQGSNRQGADSFLRHMPPEYRDDPVMREFYRSLHEPFLAADPLLTRSSYNTKAAKIPTQSASRPQVFNPPQTAQYPPARLPSAPTQPAQYQSAPPKQAPPQRAPPQRAPPQRAPPQPLLPQPAVPYAAAPQPVAIPQRVQPQVEKAAVINTAALCETAAPPPAPPRQYLQQCSPDSQTRLTPLPICEPCNRREYSYQPVFIALPCPGNAAYLNVGVPQSGYPSPMSQYMSSFPTFTMPYATSNLGSPNQFTFYNNPQYPATNRASSAEDNMSPQTTVKPKPAARTSASSNERGSSSSSQESVDSSATSEAKSNEATDSTLNTSMETAETKATQPTEETTVSNTEPSLETTTGADISSKERMVDSADTEPPIESISTTEAIPMGKETKKTYDSIMSMAQEFSRMHYDPELEGIVFDNEEEEKKKWRKGKRQNARQQGSAYKRQIEPAF